MKRKEPPGRATRRVLRVHLNKALAGLRNPEQPEAIHKVRREIKMLRAILRLVRTAVGRKKYRTMAAALRLAPRPLAAQRDARVISRAFETLVQPAAGPFRTLRRQLLAASLQAKHKSRDFDSASVTSDLLRKVRSELLSLRLKRLKWRELRQGLEASHGRGREAFQEATRAPTTESLHQWRKRVKDLGCQLDFLSNAWPAKTRARLVALEQLGEKLGEEHDLALLEKCMYERCESGPETIRVQELVQTRRRQLRASLRRLGARLYTAPASAVGDQVEADWKRWRES
jgi:CHAD domain-containing protein